MAPPTGPTPHLQATPAGWCGRFQALGGPCEIQVEAVDQATAQALFEAGATEAQRIEHKFSRYRSDSVLGQLLAQAGQPLQVDEETAALLDFAAQCHTLSGGLFDVTSGVLGRLWRFDGSDRLPAPAAVAALLPLVGWQHVQWQRPWLTLPVGMALDLGGIGKEYAVDRVLGLLRDRCTQPLLVNFGGDLAVSGPRADGNAWQVGIDLSDGAATQPQAPAGVLALRAGGLATSGDARRYLLKDGVRYGHVLDPRTGWPVVGAPQAVTVAAPSCTEAGLLSTLALLQGPEAESWLAEQDMPHWVQR